MTPTKGHSKQGLGASKSRRSETRHFVKRLRTQIFSVHSAVISRSSSTRLRKSLAFPVVLLFLLGVVPVIFVWIRAHASLHIPPFLSRDLSHDQLNVSYTHFQPPSPFALDACVRPYDQAWSVLHARTPPPSPKSFAQIAFAIQASGDTVRLLPRLLARIHHERNVYVIHIDAKTTLEQRQKISAFINAHPRYMRNVHLFPSEMLTYKGISTVLNSIALMTLALSVHPDWDYYINLSASDYPLVSPDDICRLLARPQAPSGLLNFVWFFPRKEWIPYSFRVRFMFWDPAASGYQNPHTHLHYMVSQRTNPLEKHRAYIFTKAEAWSILSRPFVQFVVRSSFAKRMFLNHMHVLSVSEHFITDILFNHPVWRATVVPDAFRKVVWYFKGHRSGQHPYSLDRGPRTFAFWGDLEHAKSIFARKFTKPDSKLMDRIDVELSGYGLNSSDPRLEQFQKPRSTFYREIVDYFDKITQQTLKQQGYKWPITAYPKI